MNITVLGAGAWGTALALAAARQPSGAGHHRVRLWARNPVQVSDMHAHRENRRYLPGHPLGDNLQVFACEPAHLPPALQGEDLVVVATPMAALRGMLQALAQVPAPVVWLCKGFERPQGVDCAEVGLMGHEVAAQAAPLLRTGVLSGPSFAQEVAGSQPTALVAASSHPHVRDTMVRAFHGPFLRIYANDDVVGVEVGGAVKNVMAIATGLCDGLQLGLNARAALITRGLAEITRFGVALGARVDTFMGLSGLGDLVLTATGDLSRNRQVGLLLAQGQTLQQAVNSLGHVAEGVYSARTVAQRAQAVGVAMPITQAVVDLLDGKLQPQQAVAVLMGRGPVAEGA